MAVGENARQIEMSDDQAKPYLCAEFKREAAGLVLDQGYSHIEDCRSLGIVESALRRWGNQLQQECNSVTPDMPERVVQWPLRRHPPQQVRVRRSGVHP
ncbi:hypothetical protein BW686_07960 [Pseudomonas syringae]|uniref:Transposase n=1 Tax=Pseudomonas syringae TaxID=317 RepID=A0A244ETU3_PSESX|nr:hypothetical protein BW686_07960 [Pseudomonas syringae]